MIGIVGGMGPEAGLHLMKEIHRLTPAEKDQDHLPICLLSAPNKIPDRSDFLAGKISENPAMAITTLIQSLASTGAKVVGIPCNTAHSPRIFDEIKVPANVKLLHMIEEVGAHIKRTYPAISEVGILCSMGTRSTEIYEKSFSVFGIKVRHVSPELHAEIQTAIYEIKSGLHRNSNRPYEKVQKGIEYFNHHGVNLVIAGCTELSLLNFENIKDMTIIDSNRILAEALITASSKAQLQQVS